MSIPNKYPGTCVVCGGRVEAGEGVAHKDDTMLKWEIKHDRCANQAGSVYTAENKGTGPIYTATPPIYTYGAPSGRRRRVTPPSAAAQIWEGGGRLHCHGSVKAAGKLGACTDACEHILKFLRERQDVPLPRMTILDVLIFAKLVPPAVVIKPQPWIASISIGASDKNGVAPIWVDHPRRDLPIGLCGAEDGRWGLRTVFLAWIDALPDIKTEACDSQLHEARFDSFLLDGAQRFANKFTLNAHNKCLRCSLMEQEIQ